MTKPRLLVLPFTGKSFKSITDVAKKDCAIFHKDLISVGKFTKQGWTEPLVVTEDRIDSWVDAFNLMQRKGIRVPITYDHSFSTKDGAGFITKLWREGKRLFGRMEIPLSEDTKRIGTTIKAVSVGITEDFIDGTGKSLGEIVDHVTLTLFPVITPQEDFQKIAAGAEKDREIITLSLIDEGNNFEEGGAKMLDKLIKLLSLDEGAKEEDVCKAVETVLASTKDTVDVEGFKKLLNLSEGATGAKVFEATKKLQASLKAFTDKEEAGKQKKSEEDVVSNSPRYLALERETQKLQAQLAGERLLKINLALNRLQEAGKITPEIREKLDGGSILKFSKDTYSEVEVEEKERIIKLFDMLPEGASMDMEERTKHFTAISNPNAGKEEQKEQVIKKYMAENKGTDYKTAVLECSRQNSELFKP